MDTLNLAYGTHDVYLPQLVYEKSDTPGYQWMWPMPVYRQTQLNKQLKSHKRITK